MDRGWKAAATAGRTLLGLIVLLSALSSCGESTSVPPSQTPPFPTPEGPIRTGTIEGVVRVDSDDIAPLTGNIRGFEKYCGAGPLELKAYRVDAATKGLAGAFVEVDGRSADFKVATVPVLDQKACVFTPDLLVIPPGPVLFRNSDAMPHNITIQGLLNPVVKEGFPGGEAISRNLPFDEKLAVHCSVHPWMLAGLVVTRRAAHAVSGPQGQFRIEGVEAGRRTIKVWHVLGEDGTVEVDVPADGKVQVEVRWKPRAGFRASFGR